MIIKHSKQLLTLLILLISLSGCTTAPLSIPDMLEQVLPATVDIMASTKKNPEDVRSIGSGVILNAELGVVITNKHVIELDQFLYSIRLVDGSILRVVVIGYDAEHDVGLLRVMDERDLPLASQIVLGDSSTLRVGDKVFAVGSPLGQGHTVTAGIVSYLNRTEKTSKVKYIQSDVAMNPGNSGGALINERGELVGINTAILTTNNGSMGLSFSLPINLVIRSVMGIIKDAE
jgi:S1-C subfamily serine protease